MWDQLNQWHIIWWIYLTGETEEEMVIRQFCSWGAVLADSACLEWSDGADLSLERPL